MSKTVVATRRNWKWKWIWIWMILLILDLGYSFQQYYSTPLDGDMAGIILPVEQYHSMRENPLGWQVLREGKSYVGTNRYFVYTAISVYFKTTPLALQKLGITPINSLYVTCALLKVLTHLLLLLLLAKYINASFPQQRSQLFLTMLLLTPFFHTAGFYHTMGVIDHSITYTFFYALPLVGLLLFFYPFYSTISSLKNNTLLLLGYGLAIVLAFSGPLVQPLCFLISLSLAIYHLKESHLRNKNKSFGDKILLAIQHFSKRHFFLLLWFNCWCLYSFYIGTFNLENQSHALPLLDRYAQLGYGLFNILTQKIGFLLLFVIIICNLFLFKNQRTQTLLKWMAIVALLYLLLLPLGGFREYRSLVIRRDTFLPISLGIYFAFALTTLPLLFRSSFVPKKYYATGITLLLLLFTLVDGNNFYKNTCEKAAMNQLSKASENPVNLSMDCKIMSWDNIRDPKDAEVNTQLFKYWRITKSEKRYWQD